VHFQYIPVSHGRLRGRSGAIVESLAQRARREYSHGNGVIDCGTITRRSAREPQIRKRASLRPINNRLIPSPQQLPLDTIFLCEPLCLFGPAAADQPVRSGARPGPARTRRRF